MYILQNKPKGSNVIGTRRCLMHVGHNSYKLCNHDIFIVKSIYVLSLHIILVINIVAALDDSNKKTFLILLIMNQVIL